VDEAIRLPHRMKKDRAGFWWEPTVLNARFVSPAHASQEGQSRPGSFVAATIQRHSVSVLPMGTSNRPLLHTSRSVNERGCSVCDRVVSSLPGRVALLGGDWRQIAVNNSVNNLLPTTRNHWVSSGITANVVNNQRTIFSRIPGTTGSCPSYRLEEPASPSTCIELLTGA
jgi:hypothetical protein